jgi:23S rRNA (uracil1939-C5)-methyltransferase
VRPGDLVTLTVEKGIYRGLGLARVEGRAVLVSRGLPGDRLVARITAVERGFARASIERRLGGSPDRREAPCALAERCGGCAYQELDYPAQLQLKEAILRESLARGGVAWEGPIRVVGSPREGWRTRATFHVSTPGGRVLLGLREPGSHRVVDLPRCLQVSDAMNAVIARLRRGLEQRAGLARRVSDLRLLEGREPGRVVACLEGELGPADAPQILGLQEGTPLAGLGVRFGASPARRHARLAGDDSVTSAVLGRHFRIHSESFFQANRFLVEALAERVRDHVPAGRRVLDLYSGVGLFALSLAPAAGAVLGIEGSAQAVADALANAEAAGLDHVRFLRGDVGRVLQGLPAEPEESVVLDPPRGGAGAAVMRLVSARAPETIVYVSCDPPTLARDLGILRAGGYALAALDLFDLFPDTFHLEAVALVRRPSAL